MSRTRIAHTGVRATVAVYHLWAHLSGQRSLPLFPDMTLINFLDRHDDGPVKTWHYEAAYN